MNKHFIEAIRFLKAGKLISFPSETVYALGCDAGNSDAVEAVFEAKGRPSDKRLAVMCASLEQAKKIAVFSDEALLLAKKYWPGALTLVLPLAPSNGLASNVLAGGTTVAVRIPDHLLALSLIEAYGAPLVATSANKSGEPPALSAAEVKAVLGDKVSCVVDGGQATIGQASTIIDTTVRPFKILRQGSLVLSQ